MSFEFMKDYYPFFLKGAGITIVIAFFAVIFGTVLGLLLSLMKLSENKILRFIAGAYIEFVRGTPSLVQIWIVYLGLSNIGLNLPDLVTGIIALSLNSGAYVAEIIRAGIGAVDTGQMEAARSLGMKKSMAMREIIIPQALKNILPALGNEFIAVIKESAIVSIIGVGELMFNAQTVGGTLYNGLPPLYVAAAIYFVITFSLSRGLAKLERRLKKSDSHQ
ncbi:MAG: amino acid ABC transporter permease [Inconstantimicrobium porci]|uniref:Amino acid ABC transporter permease n=1 Tax=Inconstantimicrobium porci TaxID=2652291 RepID=A0A7X2T1K1_9CLOT|nr:amino acid ABC transporter permease [Inconstantimicrobium porci]MDD6770041.1 amino acid ABC transporter permease [Inconstantimicrobium porci]MDY5913495.1 amino acid ABC transporter permease [Inconstantimicrobium porci]MSR91697.1 amino acid ABC transporter permease [Inconstantimicrobium porci]